MAPLAKERLRIPFERKNVLIAFFTAGVPDLETTGELIKIARNLGVDIIELGVPFSEPVADGPILQQACEIALRNKVTLPVILELVEDVTKQDPELDILLMGYAQPFFFYGIEEMAEKTLTSGARGWIVADLPAEEAEIFYKPLDRRGGALIPLVAPTTPKERARMIADRFAPPFLYYVSVTGVTGAPSAFELGWEVPLRAIRQVTRIPIAIGFGIRTPELARHASQEAEGVVVGSAIMKPLVEKGREGIPEVVDLLSAIRSALP
jgi:tryptophan synthase alpha chain